jgi:hypothetical protein
VASAQERPDAHDLGETCIGPCAMYVKATGQATYAKPRPRVKIANCAQVSAERLAAANNLVESGSVGPMHLIPAEEMRRAASFSQHKSRFLGNRFPSRRCPGEIAPIFDTSSRISGLRRAAPLARQAMSGTLKGTKHKNGKVKTPAHAPRSALHDLRRTAAMMCGNLGLSESAIPQYLDHQATKGDDVQPLPAITSKVYNVLSSAVSSESARCWTFGPSSRDRSLGRRRWLDCLLRPDL